MTSMIATRTDPDSGRDIPACALCGWIISRIPRGKMEEEDFERLGRAFTEHVVEKHPDKAVELSQGRGKP